MMAIFAYERLLTEGTKHTPLEPLVVTKESTPRTHNVFMQYPVEVTECWANLTAGRKIEDGLLSPLDEGLIHTLIKVITEAFIDDGVVLQDDTTPSGLKPLRGELCSTELSKPEKLKVTALKAKHISEIAQHRNVGTTQGGHITTNKIPLAVAQEALDMIATATKMLLSAKEDNSKGAICYVRMSAIFQIEKC